MPIEMCTSILQFKVICVTFIFIFSVAETDANDTTIIPSPPSHAEAAFEYRFEYAWNVQEVRQGENESVLPAADVHVCRLSTEQVVQLCEGAVKDPEAMQVKIQPVYPLEVMEEKVYRFRLGGINQTKKSSIVTSACLCSTSPPIYLRDNWSDNHVHVYISHRDTYVNHIISRPNFAFNYEMVVYAKHTRIPVSMYDTKIRICRMKKEEKHQLCKYMLNQSYPKNYGIDYVTGYGRPLFEERMYYIKLADFEHTFEPPLFEPACMCPSRPPTFLRGIYHGKDLVVYVILRDELELDEITG